MIQDLKWLFVTWKLWNWEKCLGISSLACLIYSLPLGKILKDSKTSYCIYADDYCLIDLWCQSLEKTNNWIQLHFVQLQRKLIENMFSCTARDLMFSTIYLRETSVQKTYGHILINKAFGSVFKKMSLCSYICFFRQWIAYTCTKNSQYSCVKKHPDSPAVPSCMEVAWSARMLFPFQHLLCGKSDPRSSLLLVMVGRSSCSSEI